MNGVLIAVGAAMWAVLLVCAYLQWRHPHRDPDACPKCQHETGLNRRGTHCGEIEDNNGWSQTRCRCDNDYHWNYESTAA